MKGISEGQCPLPLPHLPGQSSHYGRLSLGQTCLPLGECMTTTPGDFHGFHVPGEWFPGLALHSLPRDRGVRLSGKSSSWAGKFVSYIKQALSEDSSPRPQVHPITGTLELYFRFI